MEPNKDNNKSPDLVSSAALIRTRLRRRFLHRRKYGRGSRCQSAEWWILWTTSYVKTCGYQGFLRMNYSKFFLSSICWTRLRQTFRNQS